jgi:ElaB/YqjD/DUF883 family membrane-anchored ribosome-binding protein
MSESTTETIENLYEKGEQKAGEKVKMARDRMRQGMRQAEDALEAVADYVSRNPISSVLWASAAGIAGGIGLARIASRQETHPFLDRVRDGVEAGERSWRQIRTGWHQVLSGLKTVAKGD